MTEPTPTERAIEYCHDHEDDEAADTVAEYERRIIAGLKNPYGRRDLCAPGPQGLSHRPLPDLTQPAEQDRALALLYDLQTPDDVTLETARLLAAIRNRLYALWTSTPGSPLGQPITDAEKRQAAHQRSYGITPYIDTLKPTEQPDPKPTDAELGAYVRSLLPLTDQDREPDDFAPTLSAADFLQEVCDCAYTPDPPKTSAGNARTLESVTAEVLDCLSHNDDAADDYYSAADVVSYMLDIFGEPEAPFKYEEDADRA